MSRHDTRPPALLREAPLPKFGTNARSETIDEVADLAHRAARDVRDDPAMEELVTLVEEAADLAPER